MILPNGATVVVADGETLRLFKSGGHDDARSLTPLPAPELTGGDTGASHRSSSAEPDDKTQAGITVTVAITPKLPLVAIRARFRGIR